MRNKIKIVCFTGDSGLTDYSVSLARVLGTKSDVELLTSSSLHPGFTKLGFPVRAIFRRTRHYLFDFSKFVLSTLSERPDWLLFQGPLKYPIIEGFFVSLFRYCGIKVAITIHDVLPHYPRFWSAPEFGWYYGRFDALIVHSELARDQVLGLGVKRPILVVPHGSYDLFRVSASTPSQGRSYFPSLDKNDFVVLFFGHLEPRKGFLEFVEVASRMQSVAAVKFIIAGSNESHKFGSDYARALHLAKSLPNVIVHDFRVPFEEVENYFLASDLVALPYLEGTTSGVLKLAMEFGVPVVATRVGDFSEQIPPGAGILFDATSDIVEGLESAINAALHSHQDMTISMRSYSGLESWGAIANSYLNFLLDLKDNDAKFIEHK